MRSCISKKIVFNYSFCCCMRTNKPSYHFRPFSFYLFIFSLYSFFLLLSFCCSFWPSTNNHGQKSLRHMEITIIFSLDVNSPLSRRERKPPLPPFSMLETNKHQRSVLQHCLGGSSRGLTIEEKCVFIQEKTIIVSLKALVWQNVSTLLSMVVGRIVYFQR